VLSNCQHLLIQIALLIGFVFASGLTPNRHWVWLPVVWGFEIVFVAGLALVTAAANVYVRDMRYIVESANTVLWWLVPVFYPFSIIPQRYREVYMFNPLAALVMAMRNILLEGTPPGSPLLLKLSLSSVIMLGTGLLVFKKLKRHFYDHL